MKWNNRRAQSVKNYNRFSRKGKENLACQQFAILNFWTENRSICQLRLSCATNNNDNPQSSNNPRLIRIILAAYINNRGPVHDGDNLQCIRWRRWFEEENIKQAFRYICYSSLERPRDIGVDISSWLLDKPITGYKRNFLSMKTSRNV